MKTNFGSNLAKLRRQEGYSRKELADKLSLSEQSIHYYETGTRETNFATLIKIADLFGVSIDKLIRGDVDDHKDPSKTIYDELLKVSPKSLEQLIDLARMALIKKTVPKLLKSF